MRFTISPSLELRLMKMSVHDLFTYLEIIKERERESGN